MISYEEKLKSSTISSSSINNEIFPDKNNSFKNSEIANFNNIDIYSNKDKSEFLGFNDKINFFPDSLNFNNAQYFNYNFLLNEEGLNPYELINLEPLNNKKKQKNSIFKTTIVLKKKRGRKEGTIYSNKKPSLKVQKNKYLKNIKKKIHIHDNKCLDNLQRKINVHFLSFLINISNDAIKTEINERGLNFKNINYKIKQNINEIFFKKIKSLSLRDILKMDISPKFSTFKKDENQKTLDKICKLSNWLNDFFNLTYLDLLDYYYSEQKINKIIVKNKEIYFSEKTKSFYDLLNTKKNIYIKEQLKEVLFKVFFYGTPKGSENYGKIKFTITKINTYN